MSSNAVHQMSVLLSDDRAEAIDARLVTLALEQISFNSAEAQTLWHPYGFLVTKIYEEGNRVTRLHIWPEGTRPRQSPDWPIHSHPWFLRSYVICGWLRNRIYDVSIEPRGEHQLYYVEYDKNFSKLRGSNRLATCTVRSDKLIQSKGVYTVEANTFHETLVSSRLTATFLITDSNDKEDRAPVVVGDRSAKGEYLFRRRRLANDRLRYRLDEILINLSNCEN